VFAEKRLHGSPTASVGSPLGLGCGDDWLLRLVIPRQASPETRSGSVAGRIVLRAGTVPPLWCQVDPIRNRPDLRRIVALRVCRKYALARCFDAVPCLVDSYDLTRSQANSRQRSSGGARRTLYVQSSPSRKDGAALTPWFPARAIWAQIAKESTYWA